MGARNRRERDLPTENLGAGAFPGGGRAGGYIGKDAAEENTPRAWANRDDTGTADDPGYTDAPGVGVGDMGDVTDLAMGTGMGAEAVPRGRAGRGAGVGAGTDAGTNGIDSDIREALDERGIESGMHIEEREGEHDNKFGEGDRAVYVDDEADITGNPS